MRERLHSMPPDDKELCRHGEFNTHLGPWEIMELLCSGRPFCKFMFLRRASAWLSGLIKTGTEPSSDKWPDIKNHSRVTRRGREVFKKTPSFSATPFPKHADTFAAGKAAFICNWLGLAELSQTGGGRLR